jgi:hypothetical protein
VQGQAIGIAVVIIERCLDVRRNRRHLSSVHVHEVARVDGLRESPGLFASHQRIAGPIANQKLINELSTTRAHAQSHTGTNASRSCRCLSQ